jgi:hypothetical protein
MRNIYDEMTEAKEELDVAISNFNQVTERDAIDYWIYRIKSAQTKYDYLRKETKQAAG